MLNKLGRIITVSNLTALIVVVLVGGASIFLTRHIFQNTNKTKEISERIVMLESIHADSFHYLLAIHNFMIEPGKVYARQAIYLLVTLEGDVKKYISLTGESTTGDQEAETALLHSILGKIQKSKGVTAVFEKNYSTGPVDKSEFNGLEKFAGGIEADIAEINRINFRKISEMEKESAIYMKRIYMLYVVFLMLGGLSILIGYMVLSSKVISPIKDLASATLEFSEGTFDKRVNTSSKTEIGLLYNSFNRMADKIQEHSRLMRGFNEEMEAKVKERTLELEGANEKLRKTQNALIRSEKMAAIGQISAGVAHEIKNPLNSLFINAQILQREVSDKLSSDSRFYESVSLMKFEINRINNILEEFVKFAKYPEPQFVHNDINQVISQVAGLITENAKRSEIKVRLTLDNNIPSFRFDTLQFKTLLMNLSLNAFNALDRNGVLEFKTALDNGNVILSVSDDGKGIHEKDIDMIFSPFFSTREQGLGLGLSIVQRVVENHGGSIKCISKAGKGTVFEITLPIE